MGSFSRQAMFWVFYILALPARKAAYALGADVGKEYITSAAILMFLWTLYPIAWG
jgi:bacteriorhodopsin